MPRIFDIPSSWNDFFFVDFSPVYQRPFFRGFDGGGAAAVSLLFAVQSRFFFDTVPCLYVRSYSYFLVNCGQRIVQKIGNYQISSKYHVVLSNIIHSKT